MIEEMEVSVVTNGGFKILVVDDEPDICSLLEEAFQEGGYFVRAFYDPLEALQAISAEPYQLLITDLHMPKIDGLELLRRSREMRPGLPCIVLTGAPDAESAIRALRLGVTDYLTKPMDIPSLLQRARRLEEELSKPSPLASHLREGNGKLQKDYRLLVRRIQEERVNFVQAESELKNRTDQLTALNEISRVANTVLDVDTLLSLSLRILSNRLRAESSMAVLSDEEGQELVVRAASGSRRKPSARPERIDPPAAGQATEKERRLTAKKMRLDRRFLPRESLPHKTDTFLSVPLLSKGEFLGVINISKKSPGEPFTEAELGLVTVAASHIALGIQNARLLQHLKVATLRTMRALAISLETKDRYTSGHSLRVLDYSLRLARKFGLRRDELAILDCGARLHDVGKIGIAEEILLKRDPLSKRELDVIKEHPVIGEKIIAALNFPKPVGEIVRSHHESFDGSGYPDALRGEEIPLLTRIMRVADAYDAMTSVRPYRRAMSPREASDRVRGGAGSAFDPVVVEVFADVMAGSTARRQGSWASTLPLKSPPYQNAT